MQTIGIKICYLHGQHYLYVFTYIWCFFIQSSKHRIQPLMADYLLRRQEPLRVKVVCGDARVYDPILSGAQVVTLIEV